MISQSVEFFSFHKSKQGGALLLEVLIAISLLAIILSIGAQAVFVGTQSGKISGERDVAIGLSEEASEAVRGVTEEKWSNIYTLTKGSQHYKIVQSAGKWTLVAGDETIPLNYTTYTRYVVIDNVSRDPTTRAIETTYVSGNDDPNTQKATITVSWPGGSPVVTSQYLLRWRNKTCPQTNWTTPTTPTDNLSTCAGATYFEDDGTISTSTSGSIQLK
ncbi:MAG: hypothetical protein PHS95_00070 [Candidatus Pacebacteria bacterium]|nr:hypothetical protein [Candidatus Paceibacterota bacterium]